jgi:hypothetical protein
MPKNGHRGRTAAAVTDEKDKGEVLQDVWRGLYKAGWRHLVPEAFAH